MKKFEDLAHVKARLEKERVEIREILGGIGNRIGTSDIFSPKAPNFGDDVTEPMDEEADRDEEFGNQLSVHRVLQERLKEIDRELDHIAKGTYVHRP